VSRRLSLLMLLIAAVLPLGLVSGCSGAQQQDPAGLSANPWTVIKYADASGRTVEPVEPASQRAMPPTMNFSASGKLSGFASVNTFGASYDADKDGSMDIGQIATTTMAGPIELMDQEDAFLGALEQTRSYRLESGGLTLLDDADNVLVRATPEKNVPLDGTSWSCTGYNNGNEAFVSVLDDAPIDAIFSSGGLSGSAGVNDYIGTYQLADAKMDINGASATTSKTGEPDAMDQESAYLEILGDVTQYRIERDVLTLYGAGRLRLVTYVAEP